MTNQLKDIVLQVQPSYSCATEYIGKPFASIALLHQNFKEISFSDKTEVFLMEIRLDDSTLTCVIEDNVCVNAYLFSDEED